MATPTNLNTYVVDEAATNAGFGVMPASPSFDAVRTLTDSAPFVYERDTMKSEEKFADRRPGKSRPGVKKVSATIGVELTYGGACQKLLDAMACGVGASAGTYTASTLSVDATGKTITDSAAGFDLSKFHKGAFITVTGFTAAGDNVVKKEVLSATTSVITFVSTVTGLVDEAAGNEITITNAATRTKAGITRRSLAFLEDQTDLTNRYEGFLGCQVNSIDLTYEPNKPIKASFGIVGVDHTVPSATAPASSTFGTPTTTEAMNSVEADIIVNGEALGTSTSMKVTQDNGIATTPVIGQDSAYHAGGVGSTQIGLCEPSIAFTVVYDDDADQYVNAMEVGSTMPFVMSTVDPADNRIILNFPSCKITTAKKTGSGTALTMVEGTAKPERSDVFGCVYFIDYIPA
jgi:hypothetical protein